MMSQNKIDTIRAFGKNLLTPKCVSVCKYQCYLVWCLSDPAKVWSYCFYRGWECLVSSSLSLWSLSLDITSFHPVAYFVALTFEEV